VENKQRLDSDRCKGKGHKKREASKGGLQERKSEERRGKTC
jgi:hypothetical protein